MNLRFWWFWWFAEAGEFKDTGEELYHEGQVIFFNIQQYVKGVDGSIIPEADFIDEPQANEPGDEPSDPNDDQQKSTEQGNDGEIVTTQPDGSVVIVDVDGDASGRSKKGAKAYLTSTPQQVRVPSCHLNNNSDRFGLRSLNQRSTSVWFFCAQLPTNKWSC